ncbi:putative Zinc metalloproteinase nas-13 [Hypsibius exemplaris]|uniref:Metalloendopeptidase n=1 Tax=Hypsibius exemplaris TaxID=2072580 RepID=A0A1W0WEL4_HYPEX|nr:putative Zinc metalloproteinase nas-13 [Hypsibius exemplaris]
MLLILFLQKWRIKVKLFLVFLLSSAYFPAVLQAAGRKGSRIMGLHLHEWCYDGPNAALNNPCFRPGMICLGDGGTPENPQLEYKGMGLCKCRPGFEETGSTSEDTCRPRATTSFEEAECEKDDDCINLRNTTCRLSPSSDRRVCRCRDNYEQDAELSLLGQYECKAADCRLKLSDPNFCAAFYYPNSSCNSRTGSCECRYPDVLLTLPTVKRCVDPSRIPCTSDNVTDACPVPSLSEAYCHSGFCACKVSATQTGTLQINFVGELFCQGNPIGAPCYESWQCGDPPLACMRSPTGWGVCSCVPYTRPRKDHRGCERTIGVCCKTAADCGVRPAKNSPDKAFVCGRQFDTAQTGTCGCSIGSRWNGIKCQITPSSDKAICRRTSVLSFAPLWVTVEANEPSVNRIEPESGDQWNRVKRQSVRDPYRQWDHIVPVVIAEAATWFWGNGYESSDVLLIENALREMEQGMCLKFIPRTTEADYLHYLNTEFQYGNGFGKRGGSQNIGLPSGSLSPAIVIETTLQELGLVHQERRWDRDEYVKINYSNINPAEAWNLCIPLVGYFDTLLTPYDYDSILHYGPTAFAVNASIPTIVPRIPGTVIGQRKHMSLMDIQRVNALFRCEGFNYTKDPNAIPCSVDKPVSCPFVLGGVARCASGRCTCELLRGNSTGVIVPAQGQLFCASPERYEIICNNYADCPKSLTCLKPSASAIRGICQCDSYQRMWKGSSTNSQCEPAIGQCCKNTPDCGRPPSNGWHKPFSCIKPYLNGGTNVVGTCGCPFGSQWDGMGCLPIYGAGTCINTFY